MRDRLGFGEDPEWEENDDAPFEGQEDAYENEDGDTPYYDEPLDDEPAFIPSDDPLAFESYNPDHFENVVVDSDRELKVASYSPDSSTLYTQRSSHRSSDAATEFGERESNVRRISDYPRSDDSKPDHAAGDAAVDSWNQPQDPSFLDTPTPNYDRDPYSPTIEQDASAPSSVNLDSMRTVSHETSSRLEILKPKAYPDLEQIATAFKRGKTVALSLVNTRPDFAKRVLDFSFGVACALDGTVDKVAEKTYVICHDDSGLTDSQVECLRDLGILHD
ncbi:MAG: cell division protein SepF [Coriobacteriaceae bacterium]|nr:cell division protein SepF [Coriobacteriaceae bacterium]